jgi:PPOX class probable F420-dependent enzyme
MRERVRHARVAILGTINEDGTPHLVPITFALEGDVIYSAIDHKPKTTTRLKRLANIERDPRVTLLVQYYADDWSLLWWVRMEGSARLADEGVDVLLAKYPQYEERPPRGPFVAIAVSSWTGWHAGTESA